MHAVVLSVSILDLLCIIGSEVEQICYVWIISGRRRGPMKGDCLRCSLFRYLFTDPVEGFFNRVGAVGGMCLSSGYGRWPFVTQLVECHKRRDMCGAGNFNWSSSGVITLDEGGSSWWSPGEVSLGLGDGGNSPAGTSNEWCYRCDGM